MAFPVKVKFRPSTVEGRPGTIVYFVTHRRIVRQITTGYKVFPHEWDDKRSRPVSASADERTTVIQSVTRKLERDLEKLNGIIERFDLLRQGYSSEDIIMEFRRTEKENSFFIFMENVIERLRQLNHIGMVNYHAAFGSFK
ncbi:integrase [Segatella copri]